MNISTQTDQSLRIAIVGAGPAGCTLARLLTQANVQVTIFESDVSPNFRNQGGTLDLHDETGLAALRRCGLFEEFLTRARVDGDAMRVCDKHMRSWLRLPSSTDGSWFAQGKPEIDRVDLREILAESLPPGTIQWGRKLKEIDWKTNTLKFADGSEESGYDLVVGSEGAWSKVRSVLTNVRPVYSGVGGFTASILDPERTAPEVYKLVNRGSWFNYSEGSLVLGQQTGDGSIYVTIWRVMPEDWQQTAVYDVDNGTQVRTALLETYSDWSPEVQSMIKAIDPNTTIARSLYMLPVDFQWTNVPGLTLIGDAAHLMTPFIGEGVNAAMKDAMDLADAIISAGNDKARLHENVKVFEQQMNFRVTKIQKRTKDMMDMMLFTPNAPAATIERWIVRSMSDELNPLLLMFVRSFVYVGYFFYRHLLLRSVS